MTPGELQRVYALGVTDRKLFRAFLWLTLQRERVHAHTDDEDELRQVCEVLNVVDEFARRYPRGVSAETFRAAMPELTRVRWSSLKSIRDDMIHVNPFAGGRRPPRDPSPSCDGPGTDYADRGPNPEDAVAVPCEACGRYHEARLSGGAS